MPSRVTAARELAEIFRAIAHPDRIRLIEELRGGECDVGGLAERLEISGPRASQHLAVLRSLRIVTEHRDGRHHLYELTQPEMAGWIVDGLAFVEGRTKAVPESEINAARRLWTAKGDR